MGRLAPRFPLVRRYLSLPALIALVAGSQAHGAEPPSPLTSSGDSASLPEASREEIEAYLDSHALPKAADPGPPRDVPPPPPRHQGVVVEAGTGAVFPLGGLRHVSPPSPWFQLLVGYEFSRWFMLLVSGDFTLANTSYAARPPEPRTYAHYALGGGGRFQLSLTEWLAVHAQLELGVSRISEEILAQYGYSQADRMNPHYGARLGLDWLQVNPHLALGVQATFRNYPGLDGATSSDPPTALIVAAALRYAF